MPIVRALGLRQVYRCHLSSRLLVDLLIIIEELILEREDLAGVSVLPEYALRRRVIELQAHRGLFDAHVLDLDQIDQSLSLFRGDKSILVKLRSEPSSFECVVFFFLLFAIVVFCVEADSRDRISRLQLVRVNLSQLI